MLGPIFNREVLTIPRRPQHYVSRAVYLGILWILGLTAWQSTVGWSQTVTLYETGRFGPLLFRLSAVVQLVLLLFFASLTSAGAVSQEKDRRTFVLLLMTDLRNYEIVLGKLFGSLLSIYLFLFSTVPFLLLVSLLGGIGPQQIIEVTLILAALCLAAGSLGTMVALWRDKTFQALALTVLFIVLYFCFVRGLPLLVTETSGIEAWLDPLLAIDSVHQPPSADASLLSPTYGFIVVMLGISLLLNAVSLARLRRWNPSGEPIQQREAPGEEEVRELKEKEEHRQNVHAAPGPVREVGRNPILWREIFTRAYGRRPLLVKAAYFLVVGIISYYSLAPMFQGEQPGFFEAAYGLVPVCILSLLLVAAQAATAITSERDLRSLDLLLVTDLSPKEFIFGKLGGILFNAKEYLLPPLILIGAYGWLGLLATPPEETPELQDVMSFEAVVCMLLGGLILMAFTMVLGLHVALRVSNSRLAILNTLSTIFFLSVGTLVCVYLIIINGEFEYQWTSFLVFTVAGVGGLIWVLNGSKPSSALVLAGWVCPFAMLYCVITVIVGKPGTFESADPLMPFVVIAGAFGFTIAAMLVPLISEFDVALGRTTAGGE